MSITINNIHSRWILDSRGLPTVTTTIIATETNEDQEELYFEGTASVPSGASTGSYEALELRDGGKDFNGKHVTKAVSNVNDIIAQALEDQSFDNVNDFEKALLALDNTPNKNKLGANAVLSVSLAMHRVFAEVEGLSLYEFLNKNYFNSMPMVKMPRLMCNVVNGGAHADSGLAIQEFMVVPNTGSIETDVMASAEIYQTLKTNLKKDGHSTALGDEGGFAPHISTSTQVMDYLINSIKTAGYDSKCDLAMDCAASEFYDQKTAKYTMDNQEFSGSDLVSFYEGLTAKYPLISIEDGFFEDDFASWSEQTTKMGGKTYLIGDDLFVTNPARFADLALGKGLANGILIKLNQIGSVSETCKVMNDAKANNYITIVSHRSGETSDAFMSDLAVASQSEFIKLGAPARGERVAKFNRLLEIQDELDQTE
jgi:enolase